LEWTQQFLPPSRALMPPQGIVSPEHQREAAPPASAQYHSLPPSVAPPPAGYGYPGSPTRPRGQTVGAAVGRPLMNLPSLNTNVPHPGAHGANPAAMAPHQHMQQPQPPLQQEPQASPSIYFHHWQPPSTQASGGSNRPGSPSGETPKKRKATGQPQPALSPARGEFRARSPPLYLPGSMSITTSRRGRGHSRQRSDFSPFRSSGPGRARRESFGGHIRRVSPIRSSTPGSGPGPGPGTLPEHVASERSETQKPSVSSMLSEDPQPSSQQLASTHTPRESEPPADSQARAGVERPAPSRDDAGEARESEGA